MDGIGQQSVCYVNKRKITIRKSGLEWNHLKRMHPSQTVALGQPCGERSHSLSGQSARLGTSLKCLCTNEHSVGNQEEELEVCGQLWSCDPIGKRDILGYLTQMEC